MRIRRKGGEEGTGTGDNKSECKEDKTGGRMISGSSEEQSNMGWDQICMCPWMRARGGRKGWERAAKTKRGRKRTGREEEEEKDENELGGEKRRMKSEVRRKLRQERQERREEDRGERDVTDRWQGAKIYEYVCVRAFI